MNETLREVPPAPPPAPPPFVQIATSATAIDGELRHYLYGLDKDGTVWYWTGVEGNWIPISE